jgi:3-hydroxyacyl-CoA dehydrogenase
MHCNAGLLQGHFTHPPKTSWFWLVHVQGLRHADFVIEAVVEDEGIKRNIFQTLDKVRSI